MHASLSSCAPSCGTVGPVKATVVIPTYQRSARLRQLLACLVGQEGLAEAIVCDDGSHDDTRAVAQSFEHQLPLVYCHQEDLGFRAGQARNMGIRRATGEVVIFVDDDVLLAADFVREHLRAHAAFERPAIVIGFRHRTFEAPAAQPTLEEIARGEPDDRVAVLGIDGTPVTSHPRPWVYVYSCNFSVRRGVPDLVFAEDFHGWGMEDIELGYRLHKRGGLPILAAPRARVLHVEDPAPRDPFRCEERNLTPRYDTYVRNAVQFMDMHPEDRDLEGWVRSDIRWFVQDEDGHWVKNGYENDVDVVIARCREELARMGASPARRSRGDHTGPVPGPIDEERPG